MEARFPDIIYSHRYNNTVLDISEASPYIPDADTKP